MEGNQLTTNLRAWGGTSKRGLCIAGVVGSLLCLPTEADAAIVKGSVVLKKGDTVPGLSGSPNVAFIDEPFVSGNNRVGFRGQLSVGNESFIFFDGAGIHRDSDTTLSPSGA